MVNIGDKLKPGLLLKAVKILLLYILKKPLGSWRYSKEI
jgi:hypothetical protein